MKEKVFFALDHRWLWLAHPPDDVDDGLDGKKTIFRVGP
jgi:hypothetical protein